MRAILEKVSATAGFLENSPVQFSDGLNCIIGARGTCKSTLVESIRFAFDADPDRVAHLLGKPSLRNPNGLAEGVEGLIEATLRSGSIRCETHDLDDDTMYSVERDSLSDPRVYRDGVKNYTDARLLHQIEIYSQGDLQRIAEDERLRLKLIDRPNQAKIEDLHRKQVEAAEELRSAGLKIRALRSRAVILRDKTKSLPDLHARLNELQNARPELSRELEGLREEYVQRTRAIQSATRFGEECERISSILRGALGETDGLIALSSQLESFNLPEVAQVKVLSHDVLELIHSIEGAAKQLQAVPLQKGIEGLRVEAEARNEPYYELRKQEQEANESYKVEDELKRQIEQLERDRAELAKTDRDLDSLRIDRAALRKRVKTVGDEIFQLREAEVSAINERHGSLVVLTLEHGTLSTDYLHKLESVLQGSRLRGQDEIARDIASALPPETLVDIVEAADTASLSRALGRDNVQMTRLMSFLIDNPTVYELEGHIFEDHLSITMFDEGYPKPVHTLSKGQKATALLPLILRDAPYPLIFDQPEDDLDNRFIFSSLVATIRDLKLRRQIIFVTHNANIPVSGEAETVVVMSMETPERAATPRYGSVDERQQEIIDLLEGGAEAFRERQRRYSQFLSDKEVSDAQ